MNIVVLPYYKASLQPLLHISSHSGSTTTHSHSCSLHFHLLALRITAPSPHLPYRTTPECLLLPPPPRALCVLTAASTLPPNHHYAIPSLKTTPPEMTPTPLTAQPVCMLQELAGVAWRRGRRCTVQLTLFWRSHVFLVFITGTHSSPGAYRFSRVTSSGLY